MKFLNEDFAIRFLNHTNLHMFVDTYGTPWDDFPELYDEDMEHMDYDVWAAWVRNNVLGYDETRGGNVRLPDWAFRILCKIGSAINLPALTNLDDQERLVSEYEEACILADKIAIELRYFEDNIDCGNTIGETDDAMNAIADELGCRPIEACLDKWEGFVEV